jgi:hypothetical protein
VNHIQHTWGRTDATFTPGHTDPTLTDAEVAFHLFLTDCAATPLLLLKEWAGEDCPWGTLPSNRKLAAQIDAARRQARRHLHAVQAGHQTPLPIQRQDVA